MLIVTIYSFKYFEEDERKNHFDAFFMLSYGALMMLTYSGNLITMYITFEMVTLLSMPLVLHEKTKESIDAALKYLIYLFLFNSILLQQYYYNSIIFIPCYIVIY